MNSLRKKYWLRVGALVLLIYSTLYIARPVCEFLRDKTPFSFLVNFFIGISAVMLFFHLLKKIRISKYSLPFFGIIIIIYIYVFSGISIAEEKIHFLEYGLLAFLIQRAAKLDMRKFKAYVFSIFLTAALGWIDEIIQYFLPNRYFDWRDVVFNASGGMLGLIVTYLLTEESWKKNKEEKSLTNP